MALEYNWEMQIFMTNCFGDLDGDSIEKIYWFWILAVQKV